MTDRIDCRVLGRLIGTASGWDTIDETAISYYEFVPVDELKEVLPHGGDLGVVFSEGNFEAYDPSNGKVIFRQDMIKLLRDLPRS